MPMHTYESCLSREAKKKKSKDVGFFIPTGQTSLFSFSGAHMLKWGYNNNNDETNDHHHNKIV